MGGVVQTPASELPSASAGPLVEASPVASSGVRPLILIMLAGALVRLGLWGWFRGESIHIGDELDYNTLAVNLVERGEFAMTPGTLTSIRPPLYPALVAAVYRVCGLENFQAVRLLQAGLSLCLVPLVYRLGSAAASRRVGLWAAALVCFYPSLLAFNNLLLTETLFTALLCGACLAVVLSLRSGSLGGIASSGALIGLAALTRSALWPFPVVLGAFLLATWRGGVTRRLSAVIVMVAAYGLTIAPWAVRNLQVERAFLPIDCMGGRNFMMGNYEYTPLYRAWDAISLEGERSWNTVLRKAEPEAYVRSTQGQRDKLAFRVGLRYAVRNPGLTAKRGLVKFSNFWGLERELVAGASRGFFGSWGPLGLVALTAVIFGSYAAAMLTGVFGAAVGPLADRRAHAFLLLMIAYLCGIHVITFGHSRYHLPLMPLILVYSACALVNVRWIWSQRGRWPFWLACGLCLALVAGWSWEVLVVDLERFLKALGSPA